MINPLALSVLSFMLSALGIVLIYNDILIMSPKYYFLIIIALGVIYFLVKRTHTTNRKADKLMILTISMFVSSMITSIVYNNWKLTNLISTLTLTKIVIVLLVFIATYLNFVYIRAEQSYKKKRGNQRIKEEPKEGFFKQLRGNERKDKNEIVLTLGKSAESDDV